MLGAPAAPRRSGGGRAQNCCASVAFTTRRARSVLSFVRTGAQQGGLGVSASWLCHRPRAHDGRRSTQCQQRPFGCAQPAAALGECSGMSRRAYRTAADTGCMLARCPRRAATLMRLRPPKCCASVALLTGRTRMGHCYGRCIIWQSELGFLMRAPCHPTGRVHMMSAAACNVSSARTAARKQPLSTAAAMAYQGVSSACCCLAQADKLARCHRRVRDAWTGPCTN